MESNETNVIKYALTSLISATVGSFVTYLICKKMYMRKLDEEIHNAREYYDERVKYVQSKGEPVNMSKNPKNDIQEAAKKCLDHVKERDKEIEDAMNTEENEENTSFVPKDNQINDYPREVDPKYEGEEEMKDYMESAEKDYESDSDHIDDENDNNDEEDMEEVGDDDIEVDQEDINDGSIEVLSSGLIFKKFNKHLYVISINEYLEEFKCPKTNYIFDKVQLGYYEGNDTLVNEDKEVLKIDHTICDDAINRFGDSSGDPNVVYIRNEYLKADFEVIRYGNSFVKK